MWRAYRDTKKFSLEVTGISPKIIVFFNYNTHFLLDAYNIILLHKHSEIDIFTQR